jgi:hypothetical protein
MSLLAQHFDDILWLFCHVLTSLYVSVGDSMATDVALPPVTVNFFIEDSPPPVVLLLHG